MLIVRGDRVKLEGACPQSPDVFGICDSKMICFTYFSFKKLIMFHNETVPSVHCKGLFVTIGETASANRSWA